MLEVRKGTIYTYWSGPLIPDEIQRRIENNIAMNQHMNFILCHHSQYTTKEQEDFHNKLSKKYNNFHVQEIHANNILKTEDTFLHPTYAEMIDLIISLDDEILMYVNDKAYKNSATTETRKHAFVKDYIAAHILRNKNTVILDADVECKKAIDMSSGYRQIIHPRMIPKAIIVGNDNAYNDMINMLILDVIPLFILLYKKHKPDYDTVGPDKFIFGLEHEAIASSELEHKKIFREFACSFITLADALLNCGILVPLGYFSTKMV